MLQLIRTMPVPMWILLTSVKGNYQKSQRQLIVGDNEAFCQDRYGILDKASFNRRSCTMCYFFLFHADREFRPHAHTMEYLESQNTSGGEPRRIAPDIKNSTAVGIICSSLDKDECARWSGCCSAAFDCCEAQAKSKANMPRTSTPTCPATWDGYSCWTDTVPGQAVTKLCPPYVGYAVNSRRKATKTCTVNGTWFAKSGLEWTDYTQCTGKQGFITGVYVSLGCSVASLLALVPAIIIFVLFKELRIQHRVKVHIHFFVSLALAGLTNLLWYMLVHYELLINQNHKTTVIYLNPVWCRLLSFSKIYLTSATFFWMFCEGYYLHRLISKAFEPPKSLLIVYLIGWGVPALPAINYAILRGALANTSCWSKSFGSFEWIIYTPNLCCLVMNMVFLSNILRILLFQLHAHPHEPSNFRRGLKAAFMLIPLFGIQIFLTVYRLPVGAPGEREYEYATFIMQNTQGVFVSLIYCFFNGEVIAQLQRTCASGRLRHQRRSVVNVTQVTSFDEHRSPSGSDHSINSHVAKGIRNGQLLRQKYGSDVEMDVIGVETPLKAPAQGKCRTNPGYNSRHDNAWYTAIPTLPS